MKTLRPWRKSTLQVQLYDCLLFFKLQFYTNAFQVVTVEHWKGLVGESQRDTSPIVEGGEVDGSQEQQQGVLHQVGGHGAHDKAQAIQVTFHLRFIG